MLARELNAVHLRVDTVEQALRDLCRVQVQGEGYRLSYRIAADNLRVGNDVIADSCNPLELTRSEWEQVATDNESSYFHIEVVCSDVDEHRRRVESRKSDVRGLKLPMWEEVINREYKVWSRERIVIDTAKRSEEQCLNELLASLGHNRREKS